jgi:hypothetical protein
MAVEEDPYTLLTITVQALHTTIYSMKTAILENTKITIRGESFYPEWVNELMKEV